MVSLELIIPPEDERDMETIFNEHAPGGSYVVRRAGITFEEEESLKQKTGRNNVLGLRGDSSTSAAASNSVKQNKRLNRQRRLQYERKKDILERLPEPYPLDREPKQFTDHNKILGMVTMYGFDHIDPFFLFLLPEYVSMCEGGWDPTVVIFTTENWTPLVRRNVIERSHCYRLGRSIDMKWAMYHKNISVSLAAEHRRYMRHRIDKYDLFLYHEDDIPFKFSHVNAFVEENHLLKQRLPWTGLYDNTIGFQRFRHLHRDAGRLKEGWSETDIVEQDLLEEVPTFETVCMPGEDRAVSPWKAEEEKTRRLQRQTRQLDSGDIDSKKTYPYIMVIGNTHQGAYMMTQEQAKILDVKCHFLNHSSPSREYMSSFSLFDKKPWHCGLQKLLPAERMQSFMLHHYYHTKWVSWYTISNVNDKTRTGNHYLYNANLSNPPCWTPIIEDMKVLLVDQKKAKSRGHYWRDAEAGPPSIENIPMELSETEQQEHSATAIAAATSTTATI